MARALPKHVEAALAQAGVNPAVLAQAKRNPRAAGSTSGDEMNGLEAAYAAELRLRTLAGEVAFWAFKPFNLRMAPRTYFRPDFLVLLADGTTEIVDTKGHWEEDARLKIKLAARLWPLWLFVAVHKGAGGRLEREEFPS